MASSYTSRVGQGPSHLNAVVPIFVRRPFNRLLVSSFTVRNLLSNLFQRRFPIPQETRCVQQDIDSPVFCQCTFCAGNSVQVTPTLAEPSISTGFAVEFSFHPIEGTPPTNSSLLSSCPRFGNIVRCYICFAFHSYTVRNVRCTQVTHGLVPVRYNQCFPSLGPSFPSYQNI